MEEKKKKSRWRWVWRSLAAFVVVVASGLGIASCCSRLEFSDMTEQKMMASPQFADGVFKAGNATLDMSLGKQVSSAYDFFLGKTRKIRTPSHELPRTTADLRHFESTIGDHLSATWLGHSSLLINMDGKRIMTDPVFEKKITMVGPSRFNGELPVDPAKIKDIDVVIISHDHYDHLNKASVRLLADKTDKFVMPLGVSARLIAWGIDAEKIVELDWWESYTHDDGLEIVATPSQHFSGRGVGDRNKTLWASWVQTTPFLRPPAQNILRTLEWVIRDGYPPRGILGPT